MDEWRALEHYLLAKTVPTVAHDEPEPAVAALLDPDDMTTLSTRPRSG
jgi:hypothetical protein